MNIPDNFPTNGCIKGFTDAVIRQLPHADRQRVDSLVRSWAMQGFWTGRASDLWDFCALHGKLLAESK